MNKLSCEVLDELDALREIYNDELLISDNFNGMKLSISVPLNGNCCLDGRYVNVSLDLEFDDKYPRSDIRLSVIEFWGLTDEALEELMKELRDLAARMEDNVFYYLIEKANERVNHNLPQVRCSVCLEPFSDGDGGVFSTEKHHFFHRKCANCLVLSAWREHLGILDSLRQDNPYLRAENMPLFEVLCPLCRAEPVRLSPLEAESTSAQALNDWCAVEKESADKEQLTASLLTPELLAAMAKMRRRREKQQSRVEVLADGERIEKEERLRQCLERAVGVEQDSVAVCEEVPFVAEALVVLGPSRERRRGGWGRRYCGNRQHRPR